VVFLDDTIIVCDGTYNEQVTVTKSPMLARSGNAIIVGSRCSGHRGHRRRGRDDLDEHDPRPPALAVSVLCDMTNVGASSRRAAKRALAATSQCTRQRRRALLRGRARQRQSVD
jgi:hypothetical protein